MGHRLRADGARRRSRHLHHHRHGPVHWQLPAPGPALGLRRGGAGGHLDPQPLPPLEPERHPQRGPAPRDPRRRREHLPRLLRLPLGRRPHLGGDRLRRRRSGDPVRGRRVRGRDAAAPRLHAQLARQRGQRGDAPAAAVLERDVGRRQRARGLPGQHPAQLRARHRPRRHPGPGRRAVCAAARAADQWDLHLAGHRRRRGEQHHGRELRRALDDQRAGRRHRARVGRHRPRDRRRAVGLRGADLRGRSVRSRADPDLSGRRRRSPGRGAGGQHVLHRLGGRGAGGRDRRPRAPLVVEYVGGHHRRPHAVCASHRRRGQRAGPADRPHLRRRLRRASALRPDLARSQRVRDGLPDLLMGDGERLPGRSRGLHAGHHPPERPRSLLRRRQHHVLRPHGTGLPRRRHLHLVGHGGGHPRQHHRLQPPHPLHRHRRACGLPPAEPAPGERRRLGLQRRGGGRHLERGQRRRTQRRGGDARHAV